MARKDRSRVLIGFLAALAVASCHRSTYAPEFLRTEGFRYTAGSRLIGPALDTLRVYVNATNTSAEPRAVVVSSVCAPFNRIAVTVRANGKEWNSDAWRPAKRLPARDSSGYPILCAGPLSVLGLAPMASRTFVI